MAAPLIQLTQKDVPWNFDAPCCEVFNNLKRAFTSTPILTHWIPNTQMIVETNALDYTLIVILSIMTEEEEVYPVAFHSHTFKLIKLNYDTLSSAVHTRGESL